MPSTCNKIVKKELYDKLNLKFVEDKFEDLSANPFVMLEAETIKYINIGPNSACNNFIYSRKRRDLNSQIISVTN